MYYDETIKRTVSYKKKLANKLKRQKAIMDLYGGFWYTDTEEKERRSSIKTNMDLMNGIVDDDVYNSPVNLVVEGDDVSLGYAYVQHFPLIAQISEASIGEEILMPLKISVRDVSKGSNSRKKERQKLLRRYFEESVYKPTRQQIIQEISQSTDINSLNPEEKQQLSQQVEQQVRTLTPKQIDEYMDNEYMSPEEIQGQNLMNVLYEQLELKRKKTASFEYAFSNAEFYYHIGENHGEPFFKVLDIANVQWEETPGKPWAQDGRYFTYREEVTIQEAFALDGEYLEKADVKKISELVHGYGYGEGDPKTTLDYNDEAVLFEMGEHPEKYDNMFSNLDLGTQEGQNNMVKIYDLVLNNGNTYGNGMYLTRTYTTWRDMAYYYRVKRKNLETGEVTYTWEGEHYVKRPELGDVEVKRVEKEEIWEGVKYGSGENSIYIKLRAIPNQRPSLENVHDLKLPIFGGKINTRQGHSANVSTIDLGKPWQYDFDLQMAEYKLKQSANLGKVFVMLKEMKPSTVSWGDWLTTMKYMKTLLLSATDLEKLGLDYSITQLLKGVDMSTLNDIGAAINMLNFTKKQLAESMHYSQERLGNIGQYMTATSSQAAINSSEIQTTRLFDTHNYLFTKACQYLLDVTRYIYKHNEYKSGLIMDYISKAELDIDWEMLYRAEIGVFLSISPSEIQKVKQIKERTLEIIQNQMMDIEDLFEFEMADTPAELKNIAVNISKKRKEAQAAASQEEQKKIEQIGAQKQQEFDNKAKLDISIQKMKDDSSEKNTLIDSMKFANQMDVNKNGVSDLNESKDKDREFEKEKWREEMKLKNRELDIREKEIAQKIKENSQKKKEAKK